MNETTSEGAAITGSVATSGGGFTGRDATHRYGNEGSSITFQNQDNAVLWNALITMGGKMQDVAVKLDDLPNLVGKMGTMVSTLEERVGKIELRIEPVPVTIPIPVLAPVYSRDWIIVVLIVLIVAAGAFYAGHLL